MSARSASSKVCPPFAVLYQDNKGKVLGKFNVKRKAINKSGRCSVVHPYYRQNADGDPSRFWNSKDNKKTGGDYKESEYYKNRYTKEERKVLADRANRRKIRRKNKPLVTENKRTKQNVYSWVNSNTDLPYPTTEPRQKEGKHSVGALGELDPRMD